MWDYLVPLHMHCGYDPQQQTDYSVTYLQEQKRIYVEVDRRPSETMGGVFIYNDEKGG